jgi:hypothetical protein
MYSTPMQWSYIGFSFREFSKLNGEERNRWARRIDMHLCHFENYPLNVTISMHVEYHQHIYEQGFVIMQTCSPRLRVGYLLHWG